MIAAVFAALSFSQIVDGDDAAARVLGLAGVVVGLAVHALAIRMLVARSRRGGPR